MSYRQPCPTWGQSSLDRGHDIKLPQMMMMMVMMMMMCHRTRLSGLTTARPRMSGTSSVTSSSVGLSNMELSSCYVEVMSHLLSLFASCRILCSVQRHMSTTSSDSVTTQKHPSDGLLVTSPRGHTFIPSYLHTIWSR